MFRALRRLLLKKFGGLKQFVAFIAGVAFILYCLHSFFSDDSRQIWDVQGSSLNFTVEDKCGVECPSNQMSFYIRTGEKTTIGPTVCFEGEIIISQELKNFGRGLNAAVINGKTKKAEVKYFDTYVEDAGLIRFLKKDVPVDSFIFLASFDEASSGLKEDGRQLLKMYGSTLIDGLSFRDHFIMIGQKGLREGSAIEYIGKKEKAEEFAVPLEKAGCFSLPLGPQAQMKLTLPDMVQGPNLAVGESMPRCGLKTECPADSVPVGIYTGQENLKPPYICVGDHIVMTENLNKGGRGFNVVSLSSKNLQPISAIHADTYSTDSTDLEMFLEALNHGDIIITAVSDDASRKLSYSARELFNSLGSGYIQNMRFRDVWIFIGQKGMKGFTIFEKISYSGFDGEWPKPLKHSFCVPRKLPERQIVPDPEFYRFDERREFCKKNDGYPEFCDPAHVDDVLKPVGVSNKDLHSHQIFDTPLIVIPGMNHNALVRTLETTLMQPGIKLDKVMVMWDKKFPEHGELANLFGFRNSSLPSSSKYMQQMGYAVKEALKQYNEAEHFIIIEEELLLAPDFMSFLAQCLKVLDSDTTLVGVSAWNFNGFENTSGNREIVYRVEEFPGLGFLVKKKGLESLADSFDQCCSKRAWHGWKFGGEGHFEILMPDVSRVFRSPFQGTGHDIDFLSELFIKPRMTSLQQPITLPNLNVLIEKQYEEYLHKQVAESNTLSSEDLDQCVHSIQPPPDLSLEDKRPVAIYFEQENSLDFTLLRAICRCFGLVSPHNFRPKNLHNGMLRFWYQDHHVFLIGSATAYYKNKPLTMDPITHHK